MYILNSLYIMYTLNCLASRKPSGCPCFAARHPLPHPTSPEQHKYLPLRIQLQSKPVSFKNQLHWEERQLYM